MSRGNGNLYISFVSMGQGDCTVVSLPNGKILMIDCGTARWNTDYNTGRDRSQSRDDQLTQIRQLRQGVIDTLYADRHLHNYNKIDALVMTHPDKDHCNELFSVLFEKGPEIVNVYYSYQDLARYTEGGAGSWLTNFANVTGQRYAVAINQEGVRLNGNDVANATNSGDGAIHRKSVDPTTMGFVKILQGTDSGRGAKPCEVFLLAGDVKEYQNVRDKSDAKNRGSVVTLIVFGNQKFMICGDATFNTEKFLKDTYGDTLKNLELIQMGHHGSLTSSSCSTFHDLEPAVKSIGFVNHVNPRGAVISAAVDSGSSLKLPRYETIQKYSTLPEATRRLIPRPGNTIDCWWTTMERQPNKKRKKMRRVLVSHYEQKDVDLEIVATGKLGTIEYDRSNADV